MSPAFARSNGAGVAYIQRVASQSSLSRFFAAFDSAGKTCGVSVRCGDGAWIGCRHAVKVHAGLDSTRLLRTVIKKESKWATRAPGQPCLHPLLAVVAEAQRATVAACRQQQLRQ
ncbi:MAG: hypothetical protein IPP19_09690 [Verrucomicrobia bacterium]|nr:hypothetical protein [Verrucomicrobiota bacterium]